ncbi:MAG: hypothetical protein ACI8VC_002201 [Candidatus Endobugula sp.]|jgi:hypothetical protein
MTTMSAATIFAMTMFAIVAKNNHYMISLECKNYDYAKTVI